MDDTLGTGMATPSPSAPGARRILVLATERCAGEDLLDEVRYRGGDEAVVRIVAPALVSRLQFWASDEDAGVGAADERLAASINACRGLGMTIEGEVGDPDPLQAMDDAMRTFRPHEVIVASHPRERANWLERDVVAQARARYEVPITHVVVDADGQESHTVPVEDEPRRRARERHPLVDIALLGVAIALAIAGTLGSLLLYEADASLTVLVIWGLFMDLGLKLLLIGVLWWLFLRRGRADRLDY